MPLIFTFLFFGTIFVSHFLIYRFFILFFKVEKKKTINIWRIVFIFLPFSLIIASIISHYWDNPATRGFYFVSGLWYGLFINLLVAIGIFYLLELFLRLIKINPKRSYLAYAVFGSVVIFSILGVINVFYPSVKELEVKIDDLPEAWQGKTIVQLSDVHLGKVLGANYLEKVVNITNSLDPEIILITGDLFDGMDGSLNRFIEPLNGFRAKNGVYYVNGNHEIYLGEQEAFSAIDKTDIKLLRNDVAEINGLQLIGVSYPDFSGAQDAENIILENKIFDKDKPSILLFHAPTSINQKDDTNHSELYFKPNVDFQAARNLGVDLQLSGHTHKGQLFPFNFLTHYVYAGYDYGLHKLGDFQIYISSGAGVWGPTMRTSGRSEIVKIILR